MTYDQIAKKVGEHLKVDPFKIRFWYNSIGTDSPKTVLNRPQGTQANTQLADIISERMYQTKQLQFWFELLDVSLLELETKLFIKVTWLDANLKETDTFDILVNRDGTAPEILVGLMEKLNQPGLKVDQIRLMDLGNPRRSRVVSPTEPISRVMTNLHAERIPQEEQSKQPDDQIISVFHFAKDPTRTHGLPFLFVLHPEEKVSDVKKRLQIRLGLGDKEFAKITLFAVNQNNEIKELGDEEMEIGKFKFDGHIQLGLEHPDRSAAAKRYAGFEKAIKIHN
jgi:ubiquitin carboxyl-terminal hydrolase 7